MPNVGKPRGPPRPSMAPSLQAQKPQPGRATPSAAATAPRKPTAATASTTGSVSVRTAPTRKVFEPATSTRSAPAPVSVRSAPTRQAAPPTRSAPTRQAAQPRKPMPPSKPPPTRLQKVTEALLPMPRATGSFMHLLAPPKALAEEPEEAEDFGDEAFEEANEDNFDESADEFQEIDQLSDSFAEPAEEEFGFEEHIDDDLADEPLEEEQFEEEEEQFEEEPDQEYVSAPVANAMSLLSPVAKAMSRKPMPKAMPARRTPPTRSVFADSARTAPSESVRGRKGAGSKQPFTRVFLERPDDMLEDDLEMLEEHREELQLKVEGDAPFRPIEAFEELEGILPEYTFRALEGMGITAPMPIQAQALPLILGGHDLIGIAKTGSGKTLAFLLPAIPHMEAQPKLPKGSVSPMVLILAPTRELAIQISEEAEKVLTGSKKEGNHAPTGLVAQCAYGGSKRYEQLRQMQHGGCHVLVATPGRLTDFINAGDVLLHRVTYFVLDEADRMLDMGFSDDVNGAARRIRKDRQMLFFSATWVREVEGLATGLCDQQAGPPIKLRVGQGEDGKVVVRNEILQEVEVFDDPNWQRRDKDKRERLYEHIMEVLEDDENKVLVFVNQKMLADELRDKLAVQGFKADSMHGGRNQSMRMSILESFKRGELQLLVATDVMGRGLDIQDISHIVIYDMCDIDDYVHRVGRTARGAGVQSGHALTFFEYDRRWPELAGQLASVIRDAGHEVPEDLQHIVQQVEAGQLDIQRIGEKPKKQKKRHAEFELDGKPVAKKAWTEKKASNGTQKGGDWKNWQTDDSGKTLCSYYGSARGCGSGDNCEFSHAKPNSIGLCRGCHYGDKCAFRHVEY